MLIIFYRRSGDIDSALDIARVYCLKNPKDDHGWNILGNILVDAELWREAQEAYNKSLRLNPNNTDALFDKAKFLVVTERYREALGYLDHLISKVDSKNVNYYVEKAKVLLEMGDLDSTKETITKALQLDAKNSNLMILKAQLFIQQHNMKEATSIIDSLYKTSPKSSQVLYLKGLITKDKSLQQQYFQEALKLDPNNEKLKELCK